MAELCSVFDCRNLEYGGGDAAFLESEEQINADKTIQRLGGTIKIGIVKEKSSIENKKEIENKIIDIIFSKSQDFKGKFKFGISQYGKKRIVDIKKAGMEIKNGLKDGNISSRMVTGRDKSLSSVIVEQNKLIGRGVEVVLMKKDGEILIGETLAVQPFKELSGRDYGRPARDDYSGMLPPKLARIMINLGGRGNKNIFDPFCGSGTVLSEALLMGYRDILGNDISSKAVKDTAQNLKWTAEKYNIPNYNLSLFNRDASEASAFIKKNSLDLIVTETYLGPSRGKFDIHKTASGLSKLYSSCLVEFKKILRKDGRVVMALPIFNPNSENNQKIELDIASFKKISPISLNRVKCSKMKITDKNSIIYGRPGQKVWREIIILKK